MLFGLIDAPIEFEFESAKHLRSPTTAPFPIPITVSMSADLLPQANDKVC